MKKMFTLRQLAERLRRQEDEKEDYLLPTNRMAFLSEERSRLTLGCGEPWPTTLGVNDVAHDQIAEHLGIPLRYYKWMRENLPELLDENVNRLFRHEPKERLIRTLAGTARAFLSNVYRDLDNAVAANTVFEALAEFPRVEEASCALTDSFMHVKAISPATSGEVKVGDEVCAGVAIRNSEVGLGSLLVEPLVYRLVCDNGMILRQHGIGVVRQIHLGRKLIADANGHVVRDETRESRDGLLMMQVAKTVRDAVSEDRFRTFLADAKAAAESGPVKDPAAAVERLARREKLAKGEAGSILDFLAEGGDLSKWGVANAVTRAAEEASSFDRATELERIGGDVLSYPPGEWEKVSGATS